LSNAIKYTDIGSITISVAALGDMAKISIIDTGRGISAQNQNLLFRKFQQAGSSLYTRDTEKGTGLGLYISKMMIEALGGKVYLEQSEEGKGSTFVFTLPFDKK
jgi:signal transduction histidine kinase